MNWETPLAGDLLEVVEMSIRKIVTVPDPVLRKKARKVTDFGPSFRSIDR